MQLVWAQVTDILQTDRGIQRLVCQIIDPIVQMPGTLVALHYLDYGPACNTGQLVLLNVIGDGYKNKVIPGVDGLAIVIPSTSMSEPWVGVSQTLGDGIDLDADSRDIQGANPSVATRQLDGLIGQAIKLGNLPLERRIATVDQPSSPHHDQLASTMSLNTAPVICCASHYQVPLVAAAIKVFDSEATVAYCMSDDTGLSLAFSDEIAFCVQNSLIDITVSCGQSTGGDYEAVNLHSGLLAARYVAKADYLITSIGVGEYNTGTPFGHIGVAQAEAINTVSVLEGTPIAVLRLTDPGYGAVSASDTVGVSRQTLITLAKLTLTQALVAIPTDIADDDLDELLSGLGAVGIDERHHLVQLPSGLSQIARDESITEQLSMELLEDSVSSKAVIAAGRLAVLWSKSSSQEQENLDDQDESLVVEDSSSEMLEHSTSDTEELYDDVFEDDALEATSPVSSDEEAPTSFWQKVAKALKLR
ncbi:MAG: DUF3866 family protein [Coriobacteriia bacterium]|nr:DUF3866 family protein [Coriobacteriia bacterium]